MCHAPDKVRKLEWGPAQAVQLCSLHLVGIVSETFQ